MITMPSIDALCRELPVGWSQACTDRLERELSPYLDAIRRHFLSGRRVASHLAHASSICSPITEITDPRELYETAEGTVRDERFDVQEFADYWVTTHYSCVPVVLLLLKRYPGPFPTLVDLWDRCTATVGAPVGGTSYLQWNMPGFSWKLHTDDEYEGVRSRVHVPLITTPQNLFAWAPTLDAAPDAWLLAMHLERGRVYETRTDVPHTAINEHPTDGRVHLIMDVAS